MMPPFGSFLGSKSAIGTLSSVFIIFVFFIGHFYSGAGGIAPGQKCTVRNKAPG
jgi:hypothetical protein